MNKTIFWRNTPRASHSYAQPSPARRLLGPRRLASCLALLAVILLLAACSQEAAPIVTTAAAPLPERAETQPSSVVEEAHEIVAPTPVARAEEPQAQAALPTAVPDPGDLALHADDVRLFPVPRIISGDRVTIQVLPHVPEHIAVDKVAVEIYVDGQILNSAPLTQRNWEGRAEGIYEWIWDTTGRPGTHELRVVVDGQDLIRNGDEDPTNNEAFLPVTVLKAGERPLEERDVTWITASNECCTLHVLQQTAAYRDLSELQRLVDSAVSQAVSRLDEMPDKPIDVYFIERTIGQGGFAGTEMVVTYVDRPYIGGELYELLVHEAVHVLDRQFAPQRIKLLAEGVAVWATGGHYKTEDLQGRTAALLLLNQYIPLADLANDFYPAQHEIGYLQAGAFVSFLVDRAGWSTFRDFYSNTSASDGATEAEALDANLQIYYGRTLADLESEWLAALQTSPPSEAEIADLQTTIRYFETARRYQVLYDPAAYFRTAWLPHPADVQERGNTADLTRHPRSNLNITVELMLRAADEARQAQDFARANVLLDSVGRILDQGGAFADPLASSYARIVQTAVNYGYEPQRVALNGNAADVLVTTASGFHLSSLSLEQRRGDWVFLAN